VTWLLSTFRSGFSQQLNMVILEKAIKWVKIIDDNIISYSVSDHLVLLLLINLI